MTEPTVTPTRRRGLLHNRDFVLLWAGQSVSELGSQVSVLALPLLAIDVLHATTFQVGLLTAVETLPFLLVGLPAGAWVDRMRRRPVMIAADVGRALVVASVPAAWALGILTLGQLYVVALVSGMLTVFFDVAYQSFLPVLLSTDELIDGNGKLAATESGAQVAGPAVGGLLVGALGAANAVLVDASSFVLSFVSLITIRNREPQPEREAGDDGQPTKLRHEIAEGLRFVWGEPRIRSVAGATSTSNFFSVMILAVMLVFLRRQLHVSPGRIGLLLAVGSVGGVVGAVFAARLAARLGLGRTILWTIFTCGVAFVAYPLATKSTVSFLVPIGGFLSSASGVAYNINQVSLRQALCPPRLLGRMNASVRFIVWGTMPIGGVIGGVLGTTIGLRGALWVGALGSTSAFLWVLFSPVPGVRTIPAALESEPA